jgi:hypothetical protein
MSNEWKRFFRTLATGAALILVALLFLYVIPGPCRYQYDAMPGGLIRVNRLTGSASRLEDGHYQAIKGYSYDRSTESGGWSFDDDFGPNSTISP